MSDSLRALLDSTPLGAGNAPYIESLYEQFLADPASVEPKWRDYFAGLGKGGASDVAHGPIRDALAKRAYSIGAPAAAAPATASVSSDAAAKQGAVSRLVQVYSNRGHLVADIDPLGLMKRPVPEVLELSHFGLSNADLETEFLTGSRVDAIPKRMKLKDIVAQLKQIYCGTIGAEFAHVSNSTERLWLQNRFQEGRVTNRFSAEEKKTFLRHLTAAEGLERYLATKYPAQKRFSLEGGDALVPLVDDLIQQGGLRGIEEMVIGMAHRGRLNLLVNVVGKSPQKLFSEFEGHYDVNHMQGSGDVKYHKGFSTDIKTPAGNVHVAMAFNPSHLEVVNPVVEGSVRARQQRRSDTKGDKVMPLLIHGDAAFAGQGVVMETLQMSQVRGFYTGGTVHVIINNQVGFTISKPEDARSTMYCSDVAKMIEAPIFHVNGDDPEAVAFVARLALDYRMTFHKDVVIDLVCYRRLGHNESDEPAATQPVMYSKIRAQKTPRQIYADRLVAEKVIAMADADAMVDQYRREMDEGKSQAKQSLGLIGNKHTVDWTKYHDVDLTETVNTGVRIEQLRELATKLTTLPSNLSLHRQVAKIVQDREKMTAGQLPLDWGFAENLAYASLLTEGYEVRLIGQDSGRGTFFHRHAVWHDQNSEDNYVPLQHLSPSQPRFDVYDSFLSEEAVLGFEYGFSTTEPNSLTIWEGQFGDFVNGAQVIIDQFISSGEAKWGRLCGLTLMLPHGYEGQGPEHSSARLERFLQLCAEQNMQVCVPSTPAQMFHMLRRQMKQSFRKPLVIMSPKSLLRHKLSVSQLDDLTHGSFRTVIDEVDDIQASKVTRVVFCSGKVYFDLLDSRRGDGLHNVAIVRVEQLYPFPAEEYAAIVKKYSNAKEIVWCQEEPQNQGAWYQIRHRLQESLSKDHQLLYAGRAPAAAPATGIAQMHQEQQQALVDAALRSTSTEESLRHTTRLKAANK
ncbi:2-oxoglutarate dehydrogenase subunit E1 [Steroidobacter agaridevorans]|uniref:2-oxoglutarate dehydrogenase E1 component n=1 Tax=Steroidobacter agaridevorans TaxID=2695856 RepID=A0A829YML1_9GAMM|nr:2-oxoglutarate dehydrogenase E1 component [Steroidobacter agaridevorans]GFE84131.1 2-oxoglutarate dehydrogenase subunit E1 [Steroidobacter agaridevorans]GFE86953.1 2-oxoglutarate dehydrogenase subunit E1 [Steroidobacter agaridevorans]